MDRTFLKRTTRGEVQKSLNLLRCTVTLIRACTSFVLSFSTSSVKKFWEWLKISEWATFLCFRLFGHPLIFMQRIYNKALNIDYDEYKIFFFFLISLWLLSTLPRTNQLLSHAFNCILYSHVDADLGNAWHSCMFFQYIFPDFRTHSMCFSRKADLFNSRI